MREIDVTDEALIHADPGAVFKAIIDLMAGDGSWWHPHLLVSPLGAPKPGQVGGLAEIRVPGRARFTARVEEVVAPAQLRVAYVSGTFRGTGRWSFDPEAAGTRIRFRWQVVPQHWWMRGLVAPLVQRNHSRVMHIGFKLLDAHLRAAASAH
ncbi:MAG TPA: SRPBCC family protein [Polyangiaceae bacterium]|nr:SRPBCC family protein [Polyangiaceae bacterium]